MKARALEHARMRYDTLKPSERFLRVGKLATPEKLEAFLFVARERGDAELADEVRARIASLKAFYLLRAGGAERVTVAEEKVRGLKKIVEEEFYDEALKKPINWKPIERPTPATRKTPKVKDASGKEAVVEFERDITL